MELKETTLHSYDFADGFGILSTFSQVGEGKQLDWDKLEDFVELHKNEIVYIDGGMAEDWGATYGTLWDMNEGFIENSGAWLSSRWATPAIQVFYLDGTEKVFEMYKEGM